MVIDALDICGTSDPISATADAPPANKAAIAARMRAPRSPSTCAMTSTSPTISSTSEQAQAGVTTTTRRTPGAADPSRVSRSNAVSSTGSGAIPSDLNSRVLPPAEGARVRSARTFASAAPAIHETPTGRSGQAPIGAVP